MLVEILGQTTGAIGLRYRAVASCSEGRETRATAVVRKHGADDVHVHSFEGARGPAVCVFSAAGVDNEDQGRPCTSLGEEKYAVYFFLLGNNP